MEIRLSKKNHFQEDRAKLNKLLYVKTNTNRTHTVDVYEWSGTQEGLVWFITTETDDKKNKMRLQMEMVMRSLIE